MGGELHLRGGVVNRTGYVLLFATVLTLGFIGRPGPLLAAAVLLVAATTAHFLATEGGDS